MSGHVVLGVAGTLIGLVGIAGLALGLWSAARGCRCPEDAGIGVVGSDTAQRVEPAGVVYRARRAPITRGVGDCRPVVAGRRRCRSGGSR